MSSKLDPFEVTDDIDYRLVALRAEGDNARVYKAQQTDSGRLLAVKVYDRLADKGKEELHRKQIKYEANILKQIRGRNKYVLAAGGLRNLDDYTIKVHLPMHLYFHDLSYLMQATRDERGIVKNRIVVPDYYNTVLSQMLDALRFLHRKDIMILHRNIDCRHIVYSDIKHFVLVGFGLARFGSAPKGEHGGPARSFMHMAPEVYAEEEETTKVDVWALGLLCLDMLCMVPPLPLLGDPDTTFRILRDDPWRDKLCRLVKDLDKPEVEMMIVKDVGKRFAAGAVLDFVESDPSLQRKSYPMSVDLGYLIMNEQSKFKGWTEERIREFVANHLARFDSTEARSIPGGVTEGRQPASGTRTATTGSAVPQVGQTAGSTPAQPAPPSGPPPTGSGGEAGPSRQPLSLPGLPPPRSVGRRGLSSWARSPPLADPGISEDEASARVAMLMEGDAIYVGLADLIAEVRAMDSQRTAGPSSTPPDVQRTGSRDVGEIGSGRAGRSEAPGRLTSGRSKTPPQQAEAKAESRRSSPPPTTRPAGQGRRVDPQAGTSSPSSSPTASGVRERTPTRKTTQPSQARSGLASGSGEAPRQVSAAAAAPGRQSSQSEADPTDRPSHRRQEAQGQHQQAGQSGPKEAEGKQRDVPKNTGRGKRSGRGKNRR